MNIVMFNKSRLTTHMPLKLKNEEIALDKHQIGRNWVIAEI